MHISAGFGSVVTAAGRKQPDAPTGTRRRPRSVAWLPVAILALVVVFGLLFYGESRYRSCIARAEAQFPAIPVSALNQRATGPLKVSFVEERARALESCGRF